MNWFILGSTPHEITEAVKENWPEANPAALIGAVRDHVAAQWPVVTGEAKPLLLGWIFELRRHLIKKMVEIGNFEGADKVAERLLKMLDRS